MKSRPPFKVELHANDTGWRWRQVSTHNGKIVGASSEGFTRKNKALKNLLLVTPGYVLVEGGMQTGWVVYTEVDTFIPIMVVDK